jgi:hypothetical protein
MRARAVRGVVAAVGVAALLFGCGESGGSGGSSAEPQRAEREAEPAGLAEPVSLHIGGGFAGVDHGIVVAPGGGVRVSDREERREARPLTDGELAGLEESLADVDFARVPGHSIDPDAADMFQYRLEYGEHAVVTDRSRSLGAVDEVIGRLEGYLNDRTGQDR